MFCLGLVVLLRASHTDYHWDRLRSYIYLPHACLLLLSCVVSRDMWVMCCVMLFCDVPRASDTSIVVLGVCDS
jgi:hypothetical protein